MKYNDITNTQLSDTAADSVINRSAEQAALESHLQALEERLSTSCAESAPHAKEIADLSLQMARTLVGLERGAEAWGLGREVPRRLRRPRRTGSRPQTPAT